MKAKKVLITAGGTGGHLYPAQALAEKLLKDPSAAEVLFVAGGLGKSRYFDGSRFSFQEVACSPLLSRNPLRCAKGVKNLVKGVGESVKILKEYQADVVVGFGSYYTIPILIAARWLRIPIILHEANSIPGRANRWLSRLADQVGVHFPHTSSFFKGKAVEVGLPLREGYQVEAVCRKEAHAYYGLTAEKKTLLVCGGSQGARAINLLLEKSLSVLKRLDLQVIHFTGDPKKADELAALYAAHQITANVKPFESNMQFAWRAADFFIGRSGASTVAESIEFEVPGILIPYPFATDNHQEKNADFLVEVVKGGVKRIEGSLTPELLEETIMNLFEGGQHHLFREALRTHKLRPNQLTLDQLILSIEPFAKLRLNRGKK